MGTTKSKTQPGIHILPISSIIGLTLLVAVTGSLFTTPEIPTWYNSLDLPSWTPSGSIIGLVWTIIFILTACSAILIWQNAPRNRRFWRIVFLFILNGVLNVGWSYLFFNQHLIGASIVEMLVLNATTIALVILTWPINRLAATLLFPYVGWVTFATYLAYSVWQLNS